jgi:hypothetical protein
MDANSDLETVKYLADGASILTVVGTLSGLLPGVAAVFTIVWTGIRIYETDTVQSLLKKRGE